MSNDTIVVLPNKDLYRGHKRDVVAEDNVPEINAPRPFAKLDEAIAAMLREAKGRKELTCTWCGVKLQETLMREHLKSQHASIVQPPSEAELAALSAQLGKL